MKEKTKAFDCVEMKNQAQAELMREYEARKSEYASYGDFINATVNDDPEMRAIRAMIATRRHAGNRARVTLLKSTPA